MKEEKIESIDSRMYDDLMDVRAQEKIKQEKRANASEAFVYGLKMLGFAFLVVIILILMVKTIRSEFPGIIPEKITLSEPKENNSTKYAPQEITHNPQEQNQTQAQDVIVNIFIDKILQETVVKEAVKTTKAETKSQSQSKTSSKIPEPSKVFKQNPANYVQSKNKTNGKYTYKRKREGTISTWDNIKFKDMPNSLQKGGDKKKWEGKKQNIETKTGKWVDQYGNLK